jgi:hypothetical protein
MGRVQERLATLSDKDREPSSTRHSFLMGLRGLSSLLSISEMLLWIQAICGHTLQKIFLGATGSCKIEEVQVCSQKLF